MLHDVIIMNESESAWSQYFWQNAVTAILLVSLPYLGPEHHTQQTPACASLPSPQGAYAVRVHNYLIPVVDIPNLVHSHGGHQCFQTCHEIDLQDKCQHQNPHRGFCWLNLTKVFLKSFPCRGKRLNTTIILNNGSHT